MQEIVVIKQNSRGEENWRYTARVLERREQAVLLEAAFNREDMDVHGLRMGRGDRFVEIYYTDRWYNIYEIYGREDSQLKGWYCNVSRPAEITPTEICYQDLALDLLVFPDGRQKVLDEDEFASLALSEADQRQARAALAELQELFNAPGGFRVGR